MRRRPLILSLAAGAALSVAGCGKKNSEEVPIGNPPPPEPEEPDKPQPPDEPIMANPPGPGNPNPTGAGAGAPDPPAQASDDEVRERLRTADADLPAWDAVKSPHPEGATNPPSPVLIVTPDGECFKRWEGGMIPTGGDRVEVVTADGSTTQIQCPADRAVSTFDTWVGDGKPDPTVPGFPPRPKGE